MEISQKTQLYEDLGWALFDKDIPKTADYISQRTSLFEYLHILCKRVKVCSNPLIAYGITDQSAEQHFNILLQYLKQNKEPVVALISWDQIACSQENLDEILKHGLKAITHVINFLERKTCILEIIPGWQEAPVLFFFNAKAARRPEKNPEFIYDENQY